MKDSSSSNCKESQTLKDDDNVMEVIAQLESTLLLFDLDKENTAPPESKSEPDPGTKCLSEENAVLPNGIPYFNLSKYEGLYTEASLCEQFFKQEFFENYYNTCYSTGSGTSLWETLEKISLDGKMKNKNFKLFFEFCFKLLSTKQENYILQDCSKLMIDSYRRTNNIPALKIISELLPTVIQNLGGLTEQMEIDDDQPTEINSTPNTTTADQLIINLTSILRIFILFLGQKVQGSADATSKFQKSELKQLLLLVLSVAQDPNIIVSKICFDLQNCIDLILSLYPSDESLLEEVQEICETMSLYWDNYFGHELFNDKLAAFVLTDYIPTSPRGQMLRSSLAYFSLTCTISDEAEVPHDLQVAELRNFVKTSTVKLKELEIDTVCSVFLMIDAAIKTPIPIAHKNYLSEIIDWASVVCKTWHQSNKIQLNNLVNVLISNWQLYLDDEKYKKPMKSKFKDKSLRESNRPNLYNSNYI